MSIAASPSEMAVSDDVAGVRSADLEYLAGQLRSELPRLGGKHLLMTGGAGFLGYYLVQTVLHWNDTEATAPARLTVLDNFRRGAPKWLADLARAARPGIARPRCHRRDARQHARGRLCHPCRRGSRRPSLPADSDRDDGCERQRVCAACSTCGRAEEQRPRRCRVSCSTPPAKSTATPAPERSRPRRPIGATCPAPARGPATTNPSATARLCAVNFARSHGVPITIARPFNNYGPGMKITDGRVIADFCRASRRRTETSSCCPTGHRRGRSVTSPTPSSGTTRSCDPVGPASPTTSARTRPRSR